MSKAPLPLSTPQTDSDNTAAHTIAISAIDALNALVSSDHPKLAQLAGDAYKCLAKLARARSQLAYLVAKKGATK